MVVNGTNPQPCSNHLSHAKTQYEYTQSSMDDRGVAMVSMVITNHHVAHAKAQYRYAKFSMDNRDVV